MSIHILGPMHERFDEILDQKALDFLVALDYQFAGLLGYKICSKWTLLAGYRYLFVDYRSGGGLYNMVTSGAVLGATYRFK